MSDQDIKDRGEEKAPPKRRLNPEEPFPWVTFSGLAIALLGVIAGVVMVILEITK